MHQSLSHKVEAPAEQLAEKRSMLVSARMQFSPEVQEIREQAMDKCVEHVLFGLHDAGGIRIADIQEVLTTNLAKGSTQFLDVVNIANSLERLRNQGRVTAIVGVVEATYRLVDAALSELHGVETAAAVRFEKVARRLFGQTVTGLSLYTNALFDVLCVIFSQLGEQYVRILKGDLAAPPVTKSPVFSSALRLVLPRYKGLETTLFTNGLTRFFEVADPDFDAIKWNLSQNYYIAKSLGLDGSGQVLSRDLFGGATLYLDTNVVLHALDPESLHYRSFNALVDACGALNIELKVCQISLDETRNVVAANRAGFDRTVRAIPETLASRVNNIFFGAYQRALASGPVNTDSIFEAFENASVRLASKNVEVVDDEWFSDTNDSSLQMLAASIKKRSESRKGHPKSLRGAMHDAQLLKWAARERDVSGQRKVWVVTLDRALPNYDLSSSAGVTEPVAITLDALMQWISPLGVSSGAVDEIAQIFAQTIKYHVLPTENFFDLTDFIVFAELEWDCKTLPVAEVEACIRHLRSVAGALNPRLATDREKLARMLRKFFADPARKISDEISTYETILQDYEADRERTGVLHAAEVTQFQEADAKRELDAAALKNEVEALRDELAVNRASLVSRERAITAIRRCAGLALFVLGSVGVLVLALVYGDGANVWRKLCLSWPMAGPLEIVLLYACAAIVGTRNLGLLGRTLPMLQKVSPNNVR